VTLEIVAVLEEDPDLAAGLDGPRLAAAQRELRAAAVDVPTGRWDPAPQVRASRDGFGLLLLDGAIARRLGTRRRSGAELIGIGDILRPWQGDNGDSSMPFEISWRVIEPVRMALLDSRFLMRVAPYPEIAAALVGRAVSRSRNVLTHMAIAHHPRVDERLLLLLWHMADRWGRVTPHGVSLSLRLTHELLADLIAVQRPSVTLSLQQLERQGRISREGGKILLIGQPPFSTDGDEEEPDEDPSRVPREKIAERSTTDDVQRALAS
jgi:CRP-like cAMP-binding protein